MKLAGEVEILNETNNVQQLNAHVCDSVESKITGVETNWDGKFEILDCCVVKLGFESNDIQQLLVDNVSR